MKIKSNDSFTKYRLIAPLLYLMLVAGNAYAEAEQDSTSAKSKNSEPVLVTLSSQKVQIDKGGKESFSNADKVKPDDLVEYKAVYRNRSKNSINDLKASLPIPFGMQYVEKSARPTSVLASVDGIKYGQEPLMRTSKDKDGKESLTEVPYSEYQGLRWEISVLDAGKKIEVTARMRINALPKSAAELVAMPATPAIKP